MNLIPDSWQGKLSIWLIFLFFVFIGLFFIFINLGERGGNYFFSNLKLTISIMFAGLFGIGSLISGTISLIKDKERSVLVFLSTLIGFLVFLWILLEFLFPH